MLLLFTAKKTLIVIAQKFLNDFTPPQPSPPFQIASWGSYFALLKIKKGFIIYRRGRKNGV
jgi:hypothetical protein